MEENLNSITNLVGVFTIGAVISIGGIAIAYAIISKILGDEMPVEERKDNEINS